MPWLAVPTRTHMIEHVDISIALYWRLEPCSNVRFFAEYCPQDSEFVVKPRPAQVILPTNMGSGGAVEQTNPAPVRSTAQQRFVH